MTRRSALLLIPAAAAVCAGAANGPESLRGKLVKTPEGKVALQTSSGLVRLEGDPDTTAVLGDARLAGADFEVLGHRKGNVFTIDPIHTGAFFVHKNGKRYRVTYWCDVCAIRTYTPGLCMCCRQETAIDLQEPDTVGKK